MMTINENVENIVQIRGQKAEVRCQGSEIGWQIRRQRQCPFRSEILHSTHPQPPDKSGQALSRGDFFEFIGKRTY